MKVEQGIGGAGCGSPLDAALLVDYWLAVLDSVEEERVEEHLFGCDSCGARLREIVALIQEVRGLARDGSLRMVVSDEFVERAAREGLRIRQYEPPPGGSVECTVTAEDDLLIARLAANLAGARQVDLCFLDERGAEQGRMPDIPICPDTGCVIYQESMVFAKAAPTSRLIARLVARDESGAERLLGEYTFNHTRSLPGPGTWQQL
ncbi:MAG: zf-HC2 domain-containing protein [Paludibaculum sp.]